MKPKDQRIWSNTLRIIAIHGSSFAKGSAKFASITILFANSALALRPIYGEDRILDDDRRNLTDPALDRRLIDAGRAVAVVVSKYSLLDSGSTYTVQASSLAEKTDLTEGSKFEKEIAPGYCTATLMTADTMLTARHCLPTGTSAQIATCGGTTFIFDFDQSLAEVSKNQVRRCMSVLQEDIENDLAIVGLDRPILDRNPIGSLYARKPEVGEEVYAIGHPSGLPKKITGPYPVLEQKNFRAFAQLNTFKGSSGSPVFSACDFSFVGLLVAGASDYSKTKTGKSQVSLYKRLSPTEWAKRRTAAHAETFLIPEALPSQPSLIQ